MAGVDKNSIEEQNQENTLTYSNYLKIDELLSLQKPLSEPLAHDEMLFIIIHQTYELWFKQILFELEALIKYIENENMIRTFRLLKRVNEILKLAVSQVDILETMTPVEFNQFRTNLNPASGFQSAQFRELELMAGAPQETYQKFFQMNPEWMDKMKVRMQKPTLRDALYTALKKRKLLKEKTSEALCKAIQSVYEHYPNGDLYNLCEYLIEFDELFSLWRFRHVQMVERMIGMKTGTGGSLGVKYLKSTLEIRFFPELWEARTGLT